jgi:hypothetical protein
MEYDFAIIYFGLTRSVKKTHESHKKHIFEILNKENLTYKIFIHTWKTKDDTQNVWETIIPDKIDYLEYKLLSPDVYKLDDEDKFLESINMDDYFYKNVWDNLGHSHNGEWIPKMVSNHLCMLESQKRGLDMVKEYVLKGNNFKFIMFIRPDITIENNLSICKIISNNNDTDNDISNNNKIYIPNHSHNEGLNDQFAIMKYEYSHLYGNRINELEEFRKHYGRIVGEKYCKHIISKYNMKIMFLDFKYSITRP